MPEYTKGENAEEPNGLWYHASLQIKPTNGISGSKTTRHIIVEEYTNLKVSGFYPAKNKFIKSFCKRLQQQKKRGKQVQTIRMDNAGENKALHNRMTSTEWKLNISRIRWQSRHFRQSLPRQERALTQPMYHGNGFGYYFRRQP